MPDGSTPQPLSLPLPTWLVLVVLLGGGVGAGGLAGMVTGDPAPSLSVGEDPRLVRLEQKLDDTVADVAGLERSVRITAGNLILICDRLDVDCLRAE